jgi:dipeptidyl aminopeptidase/acylaminoacyl peptidase
VALPEMISVEDFFSPPTQALPTISPDGTRIAFLAPWKNRLNVWVQDVDSAEDARCVTADETRTVLSYDWTDDPRWLLYLQDNGGDENWHIYRVDLDDPDAPAVDLTPFPGAKAVFELPGGMPGEAVVYLNKRNVELMDVYETGHRHRRTHPDRREPRQSCRMAEQPEWRPVRHGPDLRR